jgi:hypothetical protein
MDKLGCGCGTHKNIIKVTSKSYLEYASKLRHVVRLRIRDMTYTCHLYISIYIYIYVHFSEKITAIFNKDSKANKSLRTATGMKNLVSKV